MKRRHKPNQSNLNFKYFVKRINLFPWFWVKIRKSPSWISASFVLDSLRSSVNVIFDHNSCTSEEKQIPEIHPRNRFGHEEIKKERVIVYSLRTTSGHFPSVNGTQMCRCTNVVLISRPKQICDPSVFLSSEVCLIVSESGGNTAKKGGPNKKDGS